MLVWVGLNFTATLWQPPPRCTRAIRMGLVWAVEASLGNPGPAGIGGVIRNNEGTVLFVLSESIGCTDSNMAEFTAVSRVCQAMIRDQGFPLPRLIFESDSRNVIRWLQNPAEVPWRFHNLLGPIMVILKLAGDVRVQHILRERNSMVDLWAKKGAANEEMKEE